MHLFNDANHAKQYPFFIKQRQVETEWGESGRGGEREKERSRLSE
jgi:hypothetical protein